MATLSGNKIKDTYQSLVKFSDNGNITTSAKQLTDGFGNNSPMFVSTTQVGIGVTPESGLNLHVFGDAKIGSNLTVIGNLVVEGSTTTVGTDTLTVKDPLIVLANNNTSTDAVDIGFYGKYHPSGTTLYSGLFREALTGKYRLFKGLEVEPTTTVNTSGTGYAVASLVANLEGNVTGNLIGSVTGGTFSGTLLSNVVATTQSANDNSTKVATTAYVDNQVGLYDTLSEVLANGNTSGANDIIIEDSQKVNYGTGSDLQIYHDATDSYIKNDTGNLTIEQTTDDADIIFKNDNGSGDTIEYFRIDGSESRIVYGRSIHMADNVSIFLGNDDDGLIRYDSTADKILYTGTSQFSGDVDFVNNVTIPETPTADTHAASKGYVDAAVEGQDTLAEILAIGNTTGGTDIAITAGDKITNFTSTGIDDNSTSTVLTIDNTNRALFSGDVSLQANLIGNTNATGDLTILGSLFVGDYGVNDDPDYLYADNNIFRIGYYSNAKQFEVNNSDFKVTATHKVGIGTNDPQTLLEVSNENSGLNPIIRLNNVDSSLSDGQNLGSIEFYNDHTNLTTGNIGMFYSTDGTIAKEMRFNFGSPYGDIFKINVNEINAIKRFTITGSGSTPRVTLANNAGEGALTYSLRSQDNGDFGIFQGSSQVLTISQSGDVGINADPDDYSKKELVITAPDEGGITIASATDEAAYLDFSDDSGLKNFIRVDHDGDIFGYNSWGSHLFTLGEGVDSLTLDDNGATFASGATFSGDVNMSNSSGATLNINSAQGAADSKILLHEGTTANPVNGASIRYDGSSNLFKIGVGTNVDTTRLTIARDTGNATFSGNVGIGGSPNAKFSVLESTANTEYASMGSGSTVARHLKFSGFIANGTNNVGHRLSALNAIALNVAGDDALYIDNSGNVTIGTGVINPSIGGDIAITQGAIGLRINDAASAISPTTATSNNDNAVDLGVSNIRFRNLYMGGTGTFGGNVGIGGNASSTHTLDLNSSSNLAIRFYDSTTFKAGMQAVDTGGQMISSSAAGDFAIRSQSNMLFSTGGNTERMRIDSSGGVLIGDGVAKIDTATKLQVSASDSGITSVWANADDIVFENNNNFGITLATPNTGAATIAFADPEAVNEGYIQYVHGDDYMRFATSATERMRIDSSGIVSIKNASVPTLRLDNTDTSLAVQTLGSLEYYQNDASGTGVGAVCKINAVNESSFQGEAALTFQTGTATSIAERMRITSGGDIQVTGGSFYNSNSGITYIGKNSEFEFVDATASVTKRFRPGVDNAFDLGDSSRRWDDVWATNPTIQTSDRNEKNTIKDTDLGLDFINKLKPVSYIWNDKTRTHYGLIAQDVEDLLSEINKDTKDFAGFIKADVSEEKDNTKHSYGLRYNEFISPMIKAIQEQQEIINDLKSRIEILENK